METGITTELIEDLKEMLIKNEGMELKLYRCPSQRLTIGVGRNIEENGISVDEAELMLKNDMDGVFADLDRNIPFWKYTPYNVRLVLCDLCFNLGIKKLTKFTKMLEAMEEEDYELASIELLDSTYAVQVKNRAKRNAKLILDEA